VRSLTTGGCVILVSLVTPCLMNVIGVHHIIIPYSLYSLSVGGEGANVIMNN